MIDLSLASSSPFGLWSLYIFHISIFFNFNFQCFLLFLGWFFLSWSLCIIVVKMTMYLSLDYGWIVLNWKTITNHYSLVSAMKKIKDLGDRFLLVFHKISRPYFYFYTLIGVPKVKGKVNRNKKAFIPNHWNFSKR